MTIDTKAVVEELTSVIKENNDASDKKHAEAIAEMETKHADKMKEISDTVLDLKKAGVANPKGINESKAKSVIVNVLKQAHKNNITNEGAFGEILDAEIKATYQNEATATEGAEFVFDVFEKSVYSIFAKFDLVAELSTINLIKGKSITLPRYDGGATAYWISEGGNFTLSKGATDDVKVDIEKLGALVTFSDEMLEDDMTTETLFNLVIKEIGVKFALKIEDEVLNGTSSKMEGILTNTDVNVETSTATSFGAITGLDVSNADGQISTMYDINPANKIAVMKKSTRNALRETVNVNGTYVFPELRGSNPMLREYRVVLSDNMPSEATAAVGILLGNVKDFYYHVARRGFTSQMGHIAGDFQAGKQTLRVDRRDGGAVKDGNAFAVIKIGTVS